MRTAITALAATVLLGRFDQPFRRARGVDHDDRALATPEQPLEASNVLVWFPEGRRSPDGRLPGIGQFLLRIEAPGVPVYIGGTFAALPRGPSIPELRRLSLTFGEAAWQSSLRPSGRIATDAECVADRLRRDSAALHEDTDRE